MDKAEQVFEKIAANGSMLEKAVTTRFKTVANLVDDSSIAKNKMFNKTEKQLKSILNTAKNTIKESKKIVATESNTGKLLKASKKDLDAVGLKYVADDALGVTKYVRKFINSDKLSHINEASSTLKNYATK